MIHTQSSQNARNHPLTFMAISPISMSIARCELEESMEFKIDQLTIVSLIEYKQFTRCSEI